MHGLQSLKFTMPGVPLLLRACTCRRPLLPCAVCAAHLCSLETRVQVKDLLAVPLGSYFDVPRGVLPEATHDYYKDPVLKVGAEHFVSFIAWALAGQVIVHDRYTRILRAEGRCCGGLSCCCSPAAAAAAASAVAAAGSAAALLCDGHELCCPPAPQRRARMCMCTSPAIAAAAPCNRCCSTST